MKTKTPPTIPDLSFTVEVAAMRRALAPLRGVGGRRNTVPILSNVLLDTRTGRLTVTATDLDLEVTVDVAASHLQPGQCTASFKTLHDLFVKLPADADATFCITDDRLVVTCGHHVTRLWTMPAADFPVADMGAAAAVFLIGAPILRAMIERIKHAISTDEARYYLNGVYFHIRKTDDAAELVAVTTDGYRLARVSGPVPDGAEQMRAMIVPRKAVRHLSALLTGYIGDVLVEQSVGNKVSFSIPGTMMRTKLIDGTFPEYGQVIPRGNDKVLTVHTDALRDVVARVGSITGRNSPAIRFEVSPDQIIVSSSNDGTGDSRETMNGGSVQYSGVPITIGFQAKYLCDLFVAVGPELTLTMSDGSGPVVCSGNDSGFLGVLMPRRV